VSSYKNHYNLTYWKQTKRLAEIAFGWSLKTFSLGFKVGRSLPSVVHIT
jgi:hypothetical protein